jgi:hypothetical protein
MSLKVVNLDERRSKPDVKEITDSLNSLYDNYERRGQSAVDTSLIMISYAYAELLGKIGDEPACVKALYEIMAKYSKNDNSIFKILFLGEE